jgi:transposase
MSLKPSDDMTIPADTARVARTIFPKGDNLCIKMRDELGLIFNDEQYRELFGRRGKPGESPGRLALVTLLQFAEDLTDREAADAVRTRIDWKYALGLELDDVGFHYSALCKFRARLLEGGVATQLFEQLLSILKERGLLSAQGKQRTDSTHICGAIRTLNRLELVGETLRHALEVLAQLAPEWLQTVAPAAWYERYSKPVYSFKWPSKAEEREENFRIIGTDGLALLTAVYEDLDHEWLRHVPAVQVLRQVWIQQFYIHDDRAHLRDPQDTPPAGLTIISPYDPEARFSRKRGTSWAGYRVHLTETCDAHRPRLITHVETRAAPEQDAVATADIHQALADKGLAPAQHLVDGAYTSGDLVISSKQEFDIDLVGPLKPGSCWQARTEEAFQLDDFGIHWEQEAVTCPAGKQSQNWKAGRDRHGKAVINVSFRRRDCQPCRLRPRCTKHKKDGRKLTLRPQAAHEALRTQRAFQQTEAYRDLYNLRSGVEGVISQAAYTLGMRRTRYRGSAKVHLQHLLTAAAINLRRTIDWLLGVPTATTRKGYFAALAPA